MAKGCDSAASFDVASRVRALTQNGYKFIGRYLNQTEGVRNGLTSSEVKRLSDAGIYIVSLYENDDGQVLSHFIRANGISDAKDAVSLADKLGMEAGCPIYFGVDRPITKSQMTSHVVPYVQGILSVLDQSSYLLGIYASKAVCKYIRGTYSATERYTFICDNDWDDGLGWTKAEMTFDDWNLRQYEWNQTLPGQMCSLMFVHPPLLAVEDGASKSIMG